MKRILALALTLGLSASVSANDIEEVKVYATKIDNSGYTMRAGLTNVALLHEYDERLDTWHYVGYTDEYGQTVKVDVDKSINETIANAVKTFFSVD